MLKYHTEYYPNLSHLIRSLLLISFPYLECLSEYAYDRVGPNIDLAIKLIRRIKGIFANKLGIYFSNKETVLELNGCQIQAYPSNHIDSFRSSN